MWLFNHCAANNCTILKHVFKVYKVAVMHMLCEVVGIMEVDYTLVMRLHNILGEQHSASDVLGYLACHVVTLS